jgi:hypothetical protein
LDAGGSLGVVFGEKSRQDAHEIFAQQRGGKCPEVSNSDAEVSNSDGNDGKGFLCDSRDCPGQMTVNSVTTIFILSVPLWNVEFT